MRWLKDLHELRKLRRDPLGYLAACRAGGRDRTLLTLPGGRIHAFFTPAAAQRVLLEQQSSYGRCRLVFNRITPLTGRQGLVQLEGPAWKALRQRYAARFSSASLAAVQPEILDTARSTVARLGAEPRIDAAQVVTQYVLANALRLFAGIDKGGDELADTFLELNRRCGARMLAPLALPSPKVMRLRKRLDRHIEPLLGTSPLASSEMPRALLRDQIKTFLFAGHETTTSSIVSALHLLARHPIAQDQARALAGEARERFLVQVYNEALRLYPPAWLMVRTAVADDPTLDVQKGDHVFLAVREIHRHPDYWEHPTEFHPERFGTRLKAPGQFIPYGGGSRVCIGQRLAPLEATALIAPLLERFRLHASQDLEMSPHITLFPTGPVWIDLEPVA